MILISMNVIPFIYLFLIIIHPILPFHPLFPPLFLPSFLPSFSLLILNLLTSLDVRFPPPPQPLVLIQWQCPLGNTKKKEKGPTKPSSVIPSVHFYPGTQFNTMQICRNSLGCLFVLDARPVPVCDGGMGEGMGARARHVSLLLARVFARNSLLYSYYACACVRVCACVRACVCSCMRAFVRPSVVLFFVFIYTSKL